VETDTHKHSPTDLARRFVLSYFMMDDSVQIFEQPVRNSGIAGGKFLERQKVRLVHVGVQESDVPGAGALG
jgi:hypothetical protein